jgi:hypothetical protein
MSIIKGVLEEEYNRLVKLRDRYEREAEKLPKGSVSVKEIAGKKYAYLAHRKGKKVVFDYVGKDSSNEVKNIRESIKKRKSLEVKLKAMKSDLKELERALGGRKI